MQLHSENGLKSSKQSGFSFFGINVIKVQFRLSGI
jgi:hypothetical protein